MKFTLRFADYLEQYMTNIDNQEPYCPVCYEQCLTFDKKVDAEHIIDCYKEELVIRRINHIVETTGRVPAIDESLIFEINEQIKDEMSEYYLKH